MKKSTLLTVGFALQSLVAFSQTISTIAGTGAPGFTGDGGAAASAKLALPQKAIADAAGNLYIADYGNHRIRKVNTAGIITTICGDGTCDTTGDGGPATAAKVCAPMGLTMDAAGNLYIADYSQAVVRKINTSGIISRFAGNGDLGYNGDGGPATAAAIGTPTGLAIDAAGNIYIADFTHSVVRKVSISGTITTVAGTGFSATSPDGVSAILSPLNGVMNIALDGAGNLYIAEAGTSKVRKVNTMTILSTVDSGLNVLDVAVDAADYIYYSSNDNKVRRIKGTTKSIIAGTGAIGYTGDGGLATSATFNIPAGISVSAAGDVYVADKNNNAIRKFASGTVGVEMPETSHIVVYPNPNHGKFSVMLPYPGIKRVSITDAVGTVVLQQVCEVGNLSVDLSGASAGIYFLTVITDGGVYRSQVVVR